MSENESNGEEPGKRRIVRKEDEKKSGNTKEELQGERMKMKWKKEMSENEGNEEEST